MTSFYITTAIDYVNAPPHLGHAYEKIATDVMARFQRLCGHNVFFLTGTDEHGIKIEKTAQAQGIDPKTHTDRIAATFQDAWRLLNISYDRFIRTTEPDHYALVERLWRTLAAKGDIYKHKYTGLYCSGCETFLTARDLNDNGECPNHLRKPEPVEEENWFFKLTAYKEVLRNHIVTHPDFVQPDFRCQEVLKFLDEAEDISISRDVESVSWGIPVPDDESQRIYVWIDALSNYLTGIGCFKDETLYNTFWPADYHIIGKDILRFHAVYWPAMLLAADIPLPKHVFAHGFININAAKISKSLGNVISPASLMERFNLPNSDAIRYYLMTCTTFGQDGSFTDEEMKLKVNADLSNNLGNLLNRTLNMAVKYFDGKVPTLANVDLSDYYKADPAYIASLQDSDEFKQLLENDERLELVPELPVLNASLREADGMLPTFMMDTNLHGVWQKYQRFDYEFAMFTVFNKLVDPVNLFIQAQEPWNLFKVGKLDQLANVIYSVLERLRQVAVLIAPVTPILSKEIFEQLGYDVTTTQAGDSAVCRELLLNGQPLRWEHLFTPLPFGQALQLRGPILPRLDSELAGAAKKQ